MDKQKVIDLGTRRAERYLRPEEYWKAHKNLIEYYSEKYKGNLAVVIEEYILYKDRCASQINSKMETCRLLGVLQEYCFEIKQYYNLQRATEVKNRWADDILEHEGIIYRKNRGIFTKDGKNVTVRHIRDAWRHATHFAVCKNGTPKRKERKSYKDEKRSAY